MIENLSFRLGADRAWKTRGSMCTLPNASQRKVRTNRYIVYIRDRRTTVALKAMEAVA